MNIYAVVDLLAVASLIALMVVALTGGGYRRPFNRLYAGFVVMLSLWIPSTHISNSLSTPPDLAIIINYIVFGSSFSAMIFLLKIVAHIADMPKFKLLVKRSEFVLWPFAFISASPLVSKGVEIQDDIYGVVFGPLIAMYGVLLFAMVIMMVIIIINGLKSQKGVVRRRLRSIGFTLLFVVPLILVFSFAVPAMTGDFKTTEFGILPLGLLAASLYYSVIRHGLFDIRAVVARALAYVVTLTALSLIYYVLAYVISAFVFHGRISNDISFSPVNIALALLLTLIFQPIKRLFDIATNSIFYRNEYDPQKALDEVGNIVASQIHVKPLLGDSLNVIEKTVKPTFAKFLLVDKEGDELHTQGFGEYPKNGNLLEKLRSAHLTVSTVDMIGDTDKSLRQELHKQNVVVVAQIDILDRVIGYLVLGEKKSGSLYGQKDLNFLSVMVDELAVAIENAERYEEIQELNLNLQRKVEEATSELQETNSKLREIDKSKDEFISMASHQLRTPLTTVKGYLSMILEGDAGEVSSNQRKFLEEAFSSSQRMVYLVGDLLNVSRIQTGKFQIDLKPSNLADALEDEVDRLKLIAKSRDIKFRYNRPASFPIVSVDEDKVRQVMMNFIDNAIYYSLPGGEIKVILSYNHDSVEFKVIDSGIGVPKNEQHKLFTKFSRASNAKKQRPDGTGIGLFMAKKVIVALGGAIIFHSVENEGSTFGFRLNRK